MDEVDKLFLLFFFGDFYANFLHIFLIFPRQVPWTKRGRKYTRGIPIMARGPGLKMFPSPPDIFSKTISLNMTSSRGGCTRGFPIVGGPVKT